MSDGYPAQSPSRPCYQPELLRHAERSCFHHRVSTTVGYGDVYPVTVAGRLSIAIILFMGLGVGAVPSGSLASALIEVSRNDDMERG
ncbi:MAG: potassium channel family protein [Myxococcota bacterium]